MNYQQFVTIFPQEIFFLTKLTSLLFPESTEVLISSGIPLYLGLFLRCHEESI